jgi:hypothetical protein
LAARDWRSDLFDDARASNGLDVVSKAWASDLRDEGNVGKI